jgi:hypothetical protein
VERDRVRDALVDALPDVDCVLVSTEIPLAAVAVAVETATAVGVPCVLNPAPVLPGLAGLLVPRRPARPAADPERRRAGRPHRSRPDRRAGRRASRHGRRRQ